MPVNYFFKTPEDVEKSALLITSSPVDWSSEDGESLKQSITLTDDEKLFAFRRAVAEMDNHKYLSHSLLVTFSFFGAYAAAEYSNGKYNLFNKPRYVS